MPGLSDDVRGELAAIDPRRPCCRLAELSALARTAGSVHLRGGGRIALHLEMASPAVARRAFSLLRSYGVPCEIRTYRAQAFERARRFQIHLEDDPRAVQALNEAGVIDTRLAPLEHVPRRVVARSCCRAAYLRGAFLAAGSVSGPRNAHLELRAAGGEAALRFGESAVVAVTRARANRLANADHANIGRASRAADAQLRAIRRLEDQGRFAELGPELREIARLRRRHPTLSLRELAGRCMPPATKASAQRRLAKLQRLAER